MKRHPAELCARDPCDKIGGYDFIQDTIKTRDDVRTKLGLACLGVVPRKIGRESLMNDLDAPDSPITEAYSAILAALRFSAETGAPKVLLLTSANPSEGKSSSSLALAQNYARRGERVLIIDADLRRPAFKGVSKTNGVFVRSMTRRFNSSPGFPLNVTVKKVGLFAL